MCAVAVCRTCETDYQDMREIMDQIDKDIVVFQKKAKAIVYVTCSPFFPIYHTKLGCISSWFSQEMMCFTSMLSLMHCSDTCNVEGHPEAEQARVAIMKMVEKVDIYR